MGESIDFEVTSGVTLSRTLIPKLPPNYLSRKHLFPLLENSPPSTTVLLAPAGYGKTSLVAEWANTQRDRVIWLTITESDSLTDMSALFIQATRNIVPGFAPWFESEPGIRPTEIVRRWGNELLGTGKNFIFVMDNFRENTSRDVDLAIRLVQQFPSNIQFVTIRRDSIENIYATFSSKGALTVLGTADLGLSESEILTLAKLHSVDFENKEIRKSLQSAHGWPAAVTMLIHHISKHKKPIDFEKLISSQSEPLRALAYSVISTLDSKTQSLLVSLSAVQEFDHEIAQIILGDEYSFDLINQIALEGIFFTQTGSPEQTFEFSAFIREVLLTELRKNQSKKKQIHSALLAFHEYRNEPNLALEHAYLAGNLEKVSLIFPNAARIMQATGHGQELIRWSIFAGDNSKTGLLKRSTVELTGHLALLDYHDVASMCTHMTFEAKNTELEGFISQISHAARAHLDLAFGRFDSFDVNFEKAMNPHDGRLQLEINEQIGLLRLAATRSFLLDDSDAVQQIYDQALLIAKPPIISETQLQLHAIKAMSLFLSGEFRLAYEEALVHYTQSTKRGFTGFFSPLESIFIIARCKWEFSKKQEARVDLATLVDLAQKWKQWHWYFYADGFLARDLALRGMAPEALEKIRAAREFAANHDDPNGLLTIIDLGELFVRYVVRDYERLSILLKRAPETNFVSQVRFSLEEQLGKRNISEMIAKLPSRTPREKIWKYLAQVGEVIDQENQAIKIMKKALDVGAAVGAKETFLRQSEEMGNLILRIASENPTVYLEELAAGVLEQMKLNHNRPSEFASSLTKRELEVLRHLSTERPISAIAATLHISLNTMKTHLKNLYRKMDVDGRVSAVEKAKTHFILQ